MRIILTAGALILYGFGALIWNPHATLIAGQTAGNQFANSDAAFIHASYVFGAIQHSYVVMTGLLLAAIFLIWAAPVRRALAKARAELMVLPLLLLPFIATDARAYYETTDKTEAYTILPNESAFWIPDVGNNKDAQAQMQSEDFLNANKVALKRFIVPHAKLGGSGGWAGWDAYVPTGRLIIVDRTPYSREWVDADDRGTSKLKQGFPCQSKEGLNITAGVSIGVSVTEADAAKFLYRFGVTPPKGDRNNPQVIFASVYYGRTLTDVMDDVGRKKVQTLVCDELAVRTFDQANSDMAKIMSEVEKKVRAYFTGVGITLDFVGWGDTFEFDKDVQAAVNRRYIAAQDQAIATMLQPLAPTIQALATADALRAFAGKSDGKLPTTIVGNPMDMNMLLGSTWGTVHPVTKPAAPAPK